MSSQGRSISLTTVTSEIVISSAIIPSGWNTGERSNTATGNFRVSQISFTEVTLTTVIVLSIPVPTPNTVPPLSVHASEIPNISPQLASSPLSPTPSQLPSPSSASSPLLRSRPRPVSPPSTPLPSKPSSSPSSSAPSPALSPLSLLPSLPSSQSSRVLSSSSLSPGSLKTSGFVLVALATTLSLLAASMIVSGIFKCRRRLIRANTFSPDTSQESIESEDCSERPDPTSPSGILGPELGDTQNFGENIDVYVAQLSSEPVTVQGDLPVGSISPFVKHYDSPASLFLDPDTAPNTAMQTKSLAGPSAPRSADINVTHPVEQIAEDGTGSNHQGLTEARASLSRVTSVAHSTAPPPYSQIGERVAEYRA